MSSSAMHSKAQANRLKIDDYDYLLKEDARRIEYSGNYAVQIEQDAVRDFGRLGEPMQMYKGEID